MVLVDVDPAAGLRAAAMPGLEPSPPEPPRKFLPRGRRALSYWADVLMNCNCGTPLGNQKGGAVANAPCVCGGEAEDRTGTPLGSQKGGTVAHAPCGGEAEGPRALWHWRTHPPEGRGRLGAGAANGRRGEEKEKVCYVQYCGGDLQPLTLTNSTQFLQALKGRPSIGHLSSPSDSEREDLQRMLEIFLGRPKIRFVVEPLRLARSLKLVVASGLLVPRGTRVPPTTDRDRCTQQCRTANSLY